MSDEARSLRRCRSVALAVMLVSALATRPGLAAENGDFLAFAAGGFDVLHNYTAGEFRGEYRFGEGLWIFKPFVGLLGTTDQSVYSYGGLRIEIPLGKRWILMPNAAVGYYNAGAGKNLGYPIEFREGAELDYRFANSTRLGLSFNHISNAGLGRNNPGEEEAAIVYSIPVDFLK